MFWNVTDLIIPRVLLSSNHFNFLQPDHEGPAPERYTKWIG